MKICKECQVSKEEECFYAYKTAKDGKDTRCIPCRQAKNKAQYEKHAEKRKAVAKQYREENPEKVAALNKAYREEHKEELNEYLRQWRAAGNKANRSIESKQQHAKHQKERWQHDPEYKARQKERAQKDRKENPEKYLNKGRQWRANNLEHSREYQRNYANVKRATDPEWKAKRNEMRQVWRHRKWHTDTFGGEGWVRSVPERLISQETVIRLHAWQKDLCYFCNKPLKPTTIEHILPRAHGGPSIDQNIVLTCKSCNFSRQERIYHQEWQPKQFFESEDFFLQQNTIGKILTAAGIKYSKSEEEGYWLLHGAEGQQRELFIISTFMASTRNPASYGGKVASMVQKKHENAIILFSHEWLGRTAACVNMLKSKLGMSSRGPGARELDVISISQQDADAFMDSHHVMGKKLGAAIRIGLTDGEKLHAVSLFTDKGDNWECDRLALRGHVPGGMSRIMKALWKDYGYKPIRSFVDSRYASGAGHETIGFKYIGKSAESYQWVFPDRVQHQRYLSNSNKMSRNLLYFNPQFSDADNIIANGIFKIWTPKRHVILWEK